VSEDLKETIKRLIDCHGRSPSRIAEELNRQKITTPTGKVWTRQSVSGYITRNLKDYEPQSSTDVSADVPGADFVPNTDVGADVVPNTDVGSRGTAPAEINDLLKGGTLESITDIHRRRTLIEMAAWWEENRQAVIKVATAPPTFTGDRHNTGIHINKVIHTRVKERIAADKHSTGGSLSRLTELLLWRFLGEPDDVLEKTVTE